jgi:hypothetical protein
MPEPVTWTFTTVAPAPPPAVAAPDPPRPLERERLTVTVTLDRGPGATYYIGEQMIVCIVVSRAVPIRVTYSGGGEADGGVLLNEVVGGTRCIQKGFSPQSLGERRIRVEAFLGGEVAASAEVGFTLSDVVDSPAGPAPNK